jgi:hypothetical protein
VAQAWLDYRGGCEGRRHYRLSSAMLGGMAAAICKVPVYRAMAYLSLIHCGRGKSYRNILRRRGVLPRIGGPKASLLFLERFAEMSGVEYQEKFRKATDRELPFCLGGSESQLSQAEQLPKSA